MTTDMHDNNASGQPLGLGSSEGLGAGAEARKRVRTVEYEPGWGWIARSPYTGKEIPEPGFRWNSRSVARDVVDSCRRTEAPNVELKGARASF